MRKLAAAIAIGAALFIAPATGDDLAEPTVKVVLEKGHGSGVAIGDGYFLTAAHVVRGNASVKVRNATGKEIMARIVGLNMLDDVAILFSTADLNTHSAEMDCRDPVIGEEIQVRGNPAGLEWVSAWGRVSGSAREIGPWRSAWLADMTVLPGNSGGPVFDAEGKIIGLAVGVMALGGAPTSFSVIAPAPAVCALRDVIQGTA